MSASRTHRLVLAGALGLGSIVALAAPALADTPPAGQGMVIVLGEGGGGFEGPGEIAQPEPAPQPPKDKAPAPQPPEPKPAPAPGPADVTDPQEPTEPKPADLPLADAGDDDPVVNPQIPPGPGEIADDPGCNATHGCEPETPGDLTDRPGGDDECHPLAASCDLTDREPADDPEDAPEVPEDLDEVDDAEVLQSTGSRGVLPRTGAGLAGIGVAGGVLTGLGAALRKLARR